MGDDELNEILARSEEEANLFHQIDKDLARENEARAAAGGWKTDLITVEELPEIYRSEQAPKLDQDVQQVGRGHRKRNNVVYEENLTELEFIKVRSTCPFHLSFLWTYQANRRLLHRRGTSSRDCPTSSRHSRWTFSQAKTSGIRF